MTMKKTILCVDDEQSLSITRLTLETRGYRVITCSTAGEALMAISQSHVDLAMSSLDLPDATASELLYGLRSFAPQLPVILLGDRRRGFHTDAPANLLLRKDSFAPAELLENIRLLLTKRRGPRRVEPQITRAQAS
jgi:DNA-binding response OmpR family regulator